MELRGESHLHYIRSFKNGSIVKTMNVGKNGRPNLVYHMLKDIYEHEDAKNLHLHPVYQPKDQFKGGFFERSCSSSEEESSIKADSENSEISYNDGHNYNGDSRDKMTLNKLKGMLRPKIVPDTYQIKCKNGYLISGDSDDPNCDKMTLNQLMGMVRRTKRKVSGYMDLTTPNEKSFPTIKGEYHTSRSTDDLIDLDLPLSSLKIKPLKKKVKKRKTNNNCLSPSSQMAMAISIKSEETPIDQSLVNSNHYPYVPINVKIEILDHIYPDCQIIPCLADDSSTDFDTLVGCSVTSSEICEVTNGRVPENEELFLPTEYEYCVVNQVSYDCLEHPEGSPLPDVTTTSNETLMIDDPEMINHRSSVLNQLELKELEDINRPPFLEISQEIYSPAENSNSRNELPQLDISSLQCHPVSDEMSWQEHDCNEVQQPNISTNDSFSCPGPNDNTGMCVFWEENDCSPNNEPLTVSSPVGNYSSESNTCFSIGSCSALVQDGSPTAVAQFPIHVGDCTSTNGLDGIQLCESGNELLASKLFLNSVELLKSPENLFSNRKVISPTSQERLFKAMNDAKLQDGSEKNKCTDQLSIDNEALNKAITELVELEFLGNAEGPEQPNRDEITVEGEQINTRPENRCKGSPPKGILKVYNRPGSPPLVTKARTSIKSCSESAISFSQRQMQDIEALALKLTKELNSLKDIVEDSLHCESGSLKYNANEIRTAIGSARKAEKSSKKWLGMMNRDCSRFCKIMELAEKKASNHSRSLISKERKKITFADEAGGELCHIKHFENDEENDMTSVILESG